MNFKNDPKFADNCEIPNKVVKKSFRRGASKKMCPN